MMRGAVLIVALVSFLFTSACSTFQPIESYTPAKARQEVSIGDDVEIVVMSGQTLFMNVTAMDARTISGTFDHRNYVIDWAQIKAISSPQFSAGKTLAAGGAVYLAVVVIVTAITAYGLMALGAFSE